MKILFVGTCRDCLYFQMNKSIMYEYVIYHCNHTGRMIAFPESIPYWCPLPDASQFENRHACSSGPCISNDCDMCKASEQEKRGRLNDKGETLHNHKILA